MRFTFQPATRQYIERIILDREIMVIPAERSECHHSRVHWWPRVWIRITSLLSKCPPLYILARCVWRTTRWTYYTSKWQSIVFFNRAVDINKTVWISPKKIVYCSLREFDILNSKGRVIGGDWDCLEKKFEDLDVYVAFKQVFTEGKNWTGTVFYQRILNRLNKGEVLWGCRNQNDLQQRCKGLETLYQRIRDEGYRSQREILQPGLVVEPLALDDEVTISIGRHGDLMFSGGAHRLAIAKLLDIAQIPAKVAVRHRGWMVVRKGLIEFAKMQGGKLYQPATHPDLMDLPAFHECEDRFLMIKKSMSAKRGRLLDIGANLGYFCHRFEDEGFESYAVENNEKELYFLRKLRRAQNRRFKIVAESVFEWSQIGEMHFDVVLALNVFHHFLKTKESYDGLVALLQELHTDQLFFEPHVPNEPQMEGAYANYSPSEFVGFIMKVTRLKSAEVIGEAKDGRTIYRLC